MSRNVKGWWVAPTLLMLMPFAMAAQEKLPTLPEVMATVQDTEVSLQGYIGRGPEGGVRFVLPDIADNGFAVDFPEGAGLDAKIEGCGFNGSGGMPCKLAGYGHLRWDGTKLHVVLTSIETIAAPALVE